MMRKTFIIRLLSVAAVLSACEGSSLPGDRPSDWLLERPELQKIVDLQEERDGEALIGYLSHEEPSMRARAAFALGSVQTPEAVPHLIRLLGDSYPPARADAAFAIGQTADSLASRALLSTLLSDRDLNVRRRCIEALGKTGGHLSLRELTTLDIPMRLLPELALAIGRCGIRRIHDPAAVELLTDFLTSSDPLVRRNAAYYFGRTNQPQSWSRVVEVVREALDGYEPDDPAAMYLLQGLSRLENEADTVRFVRWYRDSPDWRIRTNAARALGGDRLIEVSVQELLIEGLDDPSVHVSITCAQALAGASSLPSGGIDRVRDWISLHPDAWRTSGALLPLVASAGDLAFLIAWIEERSQEETMAKSLGFTAIAHSPDSRAFALLGREVDSEDTNIASASVRALAGRWRMERRRWEDIDVAGYYDLFSQALQRGDPGIAYAAAPILADSLFRPFGSIELMVAVYRRMATPVDLEPMVEILRSLGRAGDRGSLPLLESAAGHDSPVIRQAAAAALQRITGEDVEGEIGAEEPRDQPEQQIDWNYLASIGPEPRLIIETLKGTIIIRLRSEEAPLTVQTITIFAGEGRYDGVAFHRVVPNFVIQGGDFERQDGFGGPGFAIRSEFTRIPYERGVVGMASAGKDTEGSQFFITHSMQPHLDGGYTAFGFVIDGIDVVDRIYQGDVVVKATVIPDR